jgi:deoxyribonuclease-4
VPQTPVRIGIHTSTRGGVEFAAERAHQLGCDTFQIFSSSPRQWKPYTVTPRSCEEMKRLRRLHGLGPLVVHDSYLINLSAISPAVRALSAKAFRGEIERALAIGAEYVVMHPGTSEGDREAALARLADGILAATEGLAWDGLTLLLENTGGGATRLGGSFAELRSMLERLPGIPAGVCIDTCHCWIAGYDIVDPAGYEATIAELDATVGLTRVHVMHVNDTVSNRGSHWDRHQHIGEGQLGLATFARWLNDPRMAGKAFILETPRDTEEDEKKNLAALRALVGRSAREVQEEVVARARAAAVTAPAASVPASPAPAAPRPRPKSARNSALPTTVMRKPASGSARRKSAKKRRPPATKTRSRARGPAPRKGKRTAPAKKTARASLRRSSRPPVRPRGTATRA